MQMRCQRHDIMTYFLSVGNDSLVMIALKSCGCCKTSISFDSALLCALISCYMNLPPIKILAISGSLRANSSNDAVIKAAAALVPPGVQFTIYPDLARIPPFDDSQETPLPVVSFRQQLQAADGIFICTPEYAFGVSGVLKNALDWTVSSGELVNKPLALVTAATGGEKGHAALLLTFTALSSTIPAGGELVISYVRSKLGANGSISDPVTTQQLQAVVNALVALCRTGN